MAPPLRSITDSPRTESAHLAELLDAGLTFDHATNIGLANHLPMVLSALSWLGADDETLDLHHQRYAAKWAMARRDQDHFEDVLRDVWDMGIDRAVRTYAPALVDAPGAGWFHAIIRLAYGIEHRHTGEVAAGLVYWQDAAVHPTVGPPNGGTLGLREVLVEVAALPEAGSATRWEFGEQIDRPGFAEVVDQIRLDEHTMDDLAATVISAHVTGDDFGTLHMVTGTHAARVIVPLLDPGTADRFVARLVQAMAAAYLATGVPPQPSTADLAGFTAQSAPGWDDITTAAVTSRDAHVIKLTDTCRLDFDHTGDDLYRLVAARANRLLIPNGASLRSA